MLTAAGPFSVSSKVNSNLSPSLKYLRPADLTADAWQKTSFSLSSRFQ